MKAPKGFDIFTQTFTDAVRGDVEGLDGIEALKANTAGITINDVTGTAIGGTRTSATRFTRSSGVWIDRVILPISSVTGTYVVGETVTETTSTSTGVIEEVTSTRMVLKTISAAFVGAKTLTGGTSGATSTGGTVNNVVTNLAGKLAWSHASGVKTAGNWVRIKSNTATYFDTIATDALHATGTAVILSHEDYPAAGDETAYAREQMDISYGS